MITFLLPVIFVCFVVHHEENGGDGDLLRTKMLKRDRIRDTGKRKTLLVHGLGVVVDALNRVATENVGKGRSILAKCLHGKELDEADLQNLQGVTKADQKPVVIKLAKHPQCVGRRSAIAHGRRGGLTHVGSYGPTTPRR